MQGRTMLHGDHMNVLLESNALGGCWTELGRMVSFGKLPAAMRAAHDVCVEAQAYSASLSIPGADPGEIFTRFNLFMVEHGSAPEKRLYSHSQGYDTVERPFIRSDEPMKLPLRANIAIHPTFSHGQVFATICDGFIVGADGGFLHRTPKQVFEL
jgi:Xaa-Pro aminopeptidase